jgi:hypothetical protein
MKKLKTVIGGLHTLIKKNGIGKQISMFGQ